MEKWKTDLNRLENFIDKEGTFGTFGDPNKVHGAQKRIYKRDYVNTVKFNPKSGEFEPYDQRTKTYYNDKDANKFISNNVKQKRKAFFLEGAGTETPEKDLKYLRAKNKLNYLKNENQSSVWKIRNSFSNKIEGGGTVYEQEWLKSIKDAEADLLKLRAGTKYEREILKQIKLKRDSQ
jgi:hypothetical protein